MISSHGWKALTKAGSTSPTQRQKWLLAGSNNPGPQVVTATTPPGRTRRQISRRNAVISAAKNTPKTQTTASKPPSGSLVRVASPDRELDVGQPFVRRPGPGQLKQRRLHIYAEHTPRGSHGAGSRDRRRPGAAAQVEHHAAGRQPQPRHRRGAEPVPEAQRGLPVVIGRGSVGASRPVIVITCQQPRSRRAGRDPCPPAAARQPQERAQCRPVPPDRRCEPHRTRPGRVASAMGACPPSANPRSLISTWPAWPSRYAAAGIAPPRLSQRSSVFALDRLDRHIHLCGQPAAPMVSPSPEIDNPSGQPKNVTHRTR